MMVVIPRGAPEHTDTTVPSPTARFSHALNKSLRRLLVLSQPNCWQDRDGEA